MSLSADQSLKAVRTSLPLSAQAVKPHRNRHQGRLPPSKLLAGRLALFIGRCCERRRSRARPLLPMVDVALASSRRLNLVEPRAWSGWSAGD